MTHPSLHLGGRKVQIWPVTPFYGSTETVLDPTIPVEPMQLVAPAPPLEQVQPLLVNLYGVPPIFVPMPTLCSRVFQNIAPVNSVRTRSSDLTMHFLTYARTSAIPDETNIGIRRLGPSGETIINLWGIWIDVEAAPPGGGQVLRGNGGNSFCTCDLFDLILQQNLPLIILHCSLTIITLTVENRNIRRRYRLYPRAGRRDGARNSAQGHGGGGHQHAGMMQGVPTTFVYPTQLGYNHIQFSSR
ncbi:hypothetical protein BIFBRE_05073, partial [Bifidobacterium breve DSM 20213 = JCM 1192]